MSSQFGRSEPDEASDASNASWTDAVRPRDWQSPRPSGTYDLVVLGAGTAGLVTAASAAGLGACVALVERERMGGDCLNAGCVPSKALLHAARAADQATWAHHEGILGGSMPKPDFTTAMRRLRRLRAAIAPHDSAARFHDLGVDVYFGQARFADSQRVEVQSTDQTTIALPFRRAVLATGSRPHIPDTPGLATAAPLTNQTLFDLTAPPTSLGIIGGGPIGCEMAFAFARLGCPVTLVERNARLLHSEEPQASEVILQCLRAAGVQLHLDTNITRVTGGGPSTSNAPADTTTPTTLHLQSTSTPGSSQPANTRQEFTVTVERLLVAAGREPQLDGLQLDNVGAHYDARGVHVDDFLRTTNPKIYAAGDVCGRGQYTHLADFHARIVVQNALFAPGPFGRRRVSKLLVPRCTYTTPEVAQVGLTTAAADRAGIAHDVLIQPLDHVDRAILSDDTDGFVQLVMAAGSDRILGATVVAAHAGEILPTLTLAIQQRIGLRAIANTIFTYPTVAESIRKLGDAHNRSRLTSTNRRILGWLKWLKLRQ